MSNKLVEKFKELNEVVKSYFADEEVAEATETEVENEVETSEETVAFAEVTLMDGETILTYEGELAVGTPVFVMAEGEQVPAPEGAHALGGDMEGVTLVVDADGVISEIIDEREGGGAEEAPEEMMSKEEVSDIVKNEMSKISEPLNKMLEAFGELAKENEALSAELTELKKSFDEFKELPSVQDEESAKFSRANKGTRRQNYFKTLRNK